MITQNDILKEISQRELLELTDLEGTDVLNQAVLDDAIEDMKGLVESFVLIPDNPTKLLQQIAVRITLYNLKKKNGLIDKEDKEQMLEDTRYLLKMSRNQLPVTLIEQQSEVKKDQGFAFAHQPPEIETWY